jgi:type II secretory pathway pseudopilin PulG
MSTGLIIAIIVVAIIIIALLMLLPRMRGAARQKQAERELRSRREAVADEHRQEAAQREARAERAEQQARMAEQEAQRERADANLKKERASMHERGMADDELIADDERERFAGVAGPDADRDRDAHTMDDRARAATDRDPDTTAAAPQGDTDRDASPGVRSGTTDQESTDYERGREDERRFERNRLTDDVRDSDRSRSN